MTEPPDAMEVVETLLESDFYKRIELQNLIRQAEVAYYPVSNMRTYLSGRKQELSSEIAKLMVYFHGNNLVYPRVMDKIVNEDHPDVWRDVLSHVDVLLKEKGV